MFTNEGGRKPSLFSLRDRDTTETCPLRVATLGVVCAICVSWFAAPVARAGGTEPASVTSAAAILAQARAANRAAGWVHASGHIILEFKGSVIGPDGTLYPEARTNATFSAAFSTTRMFRDRTHVESVTRYKGLPAPDHRRGSLVIIGSNAAETPGTGVWQCGPPMATRLNTSTSLPGMSGPVDLGPKVHSEKVIHRGGVGVWRIRLRYDTSFQTVGFVGTATAVIRRGDDRLLRYVFAGKLRASDDSTIKIRMVDHFKGYGSPLTTKLPTVC
jgi:hypothetical protein